MGKIDQGVFGGGNLVDPFFSDGPAATLVNPLHFYHCACTNEEEKEDCYGGMSAIVFKPSYSSE